MVLPGFRVLGRGDEAELVADGGGYVPFCAWHSVKAGGFGSRASLGPRHSGVGGSRPSVRGPVGGRKGCSEGGVGVG